jgi:hypothetical protein
VIKTAGQERGIHAASSSNFARALKQSRAAVFRTVKRRERRAPGDESTRALMGFRSREWPMTNDQRMTRLQ